MSISASPSLTGGAETGDFQVMGTNCEAGTGSQFIGQFFNRTVAELDHLRAACADQMVMMPRLAHDISRETARFQQAMDDIDGRQYLQGAIHSCPPNIWQQRHDLFGGEGAGLIEYDRHDFATGRGGAIPEIAKLVDDCVDVWSHGI